MAASAQGEYVKDQAAAIDDPALQRTFEVALLTGSKIMIEYHKVRAARSRRRGDFIDLALAGKQRGVRARPPARDDGKRHRPGTSNQHIELGQALGGIAIAKVELNQNCPLAARGTFKHQRDSVTAVTWPAPRRSSPVRLLGETHRAGGHDSGDRMLVNHLGHGVLEQNHILIERLDLPLQFDAIHQINRNWHMFTAQSVEERVL
jgi:hypothetical protein